MKKEKFYLGVIILGIIFLPGCPRYFEFLPTEIPQSCLRDIPIKTADAWIRSMRFYDQFKTLGIFDVLKYSDEVAIIVSEAKAERDGLSPVEAEDTKRSVIAENQKVLDFYVLADVREELGAALGKDRSPWRFWIELYDSTVVRPASIKQVLWKSELKHVLRKKYSDFKVPLYRLEFPLCGSDLNQGRMCRGPIKFIASCHAHKREVCWLAEDGWKEPELKSGVEA